ncbi:citrate/2-methylcitrate synthase [Spongiactinospora sp. TRM90649]|uniref:citrate/2-methylcitrate synthase n=1 Tax=Spongiactinospora sp. TRM90649 TaxID=3031114 RepID=UPI0023F65CEB|nr:citrate/2-methylcitrate synthase [Spongiactinospora sp. TRM90649]MDF5751322.1 citrate/2-methylcitrate synthase [Spongiactinospora sp. TRM90649]
MNATSPEGGAGVGAPRATAEKPTKGLADVVAASTALSDIDGKAGRLFYRGYDIHDLAGRTTFEETAHLLQCGALPTRDQLAAYGAKLVDGRALGALVEANIPEIAEKMAPMEALRTLVSLAGAEDPDKDSNDVEANLRKAARLTAQQPILVARYHAARSGVSVPDPDPGLSVAANFLLQITGRTPDPRAVEIFDACLVLHADHTMNASTFAARVCAATLSDMHSAIVAAIGTLKGPLHGGANEQVMRTLQSIEPGSVASTVRQMLADHQKIMGFGHRVYKTEDPRATHLRKMSQELAQAAGDDTYFRMSREMEQVVLDEKGLYPNVDFYAATVYHYLGIPTDLFTPVFSVSRMSGWTAHVIEQHADNRLIRPDSEYIGERDQKWEPIDAR